MDAHAHYHVEYPSFHCRLVAVTKVFTQNNLISMVLKSHFLHFVIGFL